jgi:hypothetical protein
VIAKIEVGDDKTCSVSFGHAEADIYWPQPSVKGLTAEQAVEVKTLLQIAFEAGKSEQHSRLWKALRDAEPIRGGTVG